MDRSLDPVMSRGTKDQTEQDNKEICDWVFPLLIKAALGETSDLGLPQSPNAIFLMQTVHWSCCFSCGRNYTYPKWVSLQSLEGIELLHREREKPRGESEYRMDCGNWLMRWMKYNRDGQYIFWLHGTKVTQQCWMLSHSECTGKQKENLLGFPFSFYSSETWDFFSFPVRMINFLSLKWWSHLKACGQNKVLTKLNMAAFGGIYAH